jgi:hypothetical protein
MNGFHSLRAFVVVLAMSGILALFGRASAEERQHFSRGTAQFLSATEFVGAGHATHLGNYTETGTVIFTPTDVPGILRIDGAVVYTAANGDQLYATVNGQLNGVTGAITASLTYVGGSGRFEDAAGSANLLGQILQDGTISVTVEGIIAY